jgi:AraC-like DNA-binding protein
MRQFPLYALSLTLAGEGLYRDEHTPGQILTPGDCVIVIPNLPHLYGRHHGRPWREIYLVFGGPVFHTWHELLLTHLHPIARLDPPSYWAQRFQDACDPDPLRAVMHVQAILAEMIARQRERNSASDLSRSDSAFISAARAALLAQVGHAPDIEKLARRFGCSASGFRKRFTRLTGEPPGRYHARQSISHAARLLSRGQSLTETAEETGFANPFHFSRRFRQFMGMPPSQYRQLTSGR